MMMVTHAATATTVAVVTLCSVLTSGCDAAKSGAPLASASVTAAASGSAHQPSGVSKTVVIHHAGSEVTATIRRGQRLPLTQWLPEGARAADKWMHLYAEGSGKRILELKRYRETYALTHRAMLYVDEQQRPCLGLFRKVTDAMPSHVKKRLSKPKPSLVDVKRINVSLEAPAPVTEKDAAFELTIGGKSQRVSASTWEALPRPKGKGNRRGVRGWLLIDILASIDKSAAANRKARLKIHTAAGKTTSLTIQELSDGTTNARLRRNRRGQVMIRLNQATDSKRNQLRNVTRIEVLP